MALGPAFLQLANQAKARIQEIDLTQLNELKHQNIPFHLIDVREQNEWLYGVIPDAMLITKGLIEHEIERVVPNKDDVVVLYCGGGLRSALAADNLQLMGYTKVFSLCGGYQAWKNSHS
jgi:rhodanese-related sulfurtransferase